MVTGYLIMEYKRWNNIYKEYKNYGFTESMIQMTQILHFINWYGSFILLFKQQEEYIRKTINNKNVGIHQNQYSIKSNADVSLFTTN